MRILVVPEVYRPGDATACGTVNDAVSWVEGWLDMDDSLHVYWLLPPRDEAGYDAEYVHADRDRVTLIEAAGIAYDVDGGDASMLTEDGYTAAELSALREIIFENGAYLDVVVDQRRGGRALLYKWLLAHVDHWAATVRPFDVIANVHDLQVPEKYRWCAYRNDFQGSMEVCGAVFADGIWFSAGVDAGRLREEAAHLLNPSVVESALDRSVEMGTPVDIDAFEERYAEEPRWIHLAGSFWEKKNAGRAFDVARRLHEQFGIRTILTSMDAVPSKYSRPVWVDAYPEADRVTYRQALDRGDLAVCASEYETMARTPFEQAASGQVLLLRDAPWIYDCVPEDHPLVSDLEDLPDLAAAAVDRWDDAVAANRRLVQHVREVRAPAAVARRAYRDLSQRVEDKRARFAAVESRRTDGTFQAVERTLEARDGPVRLTDAVFAARDGATGGDGEKPDESPPTTDVIYALRSLGYRDRGNPGTPVFEQTTAPDGQALTESRPNR